MLAMASTGRLVLAAALIGVAASAAANDFVMPVQDAFRVTGAGTVVTGQVQQGTIAVGDTVCVGTHFGPAAVTGIESFRQVLDSATEGDSVGLLIEGLETSDVTRGDPVRHCR